MELLYIQLDREAIRERLQHTDEEPSESGAENVENMENAGGLSFVSQIDPAIPLPYILRQAAAEVETDTAALDWDGIVDGILYIALYEPKHEHCSYYKDFLLALEPELPHILQDRLRDQYAQKLWQNARDTVGILLFLLPSANWPLLELSYLYEQEAEQALQEQRFADCRDAWERASLVYKQLLQSDSMDARCYYQLGYYYLQCWNFPAAYEAFISAQQLALSPENPLWGKCHSYLQSLGICEQMQGNDEAAKALQLRWATMYNDLQRALQADKLYEAGGGQSDGSPDNTGLKTEALREFLDIYGTEATAGLKAALWLTPLADLDELLREHPQSGPLWYLRGLCLLYGSDVASLRDLAAETATAEGDAAGAAKPGRSASKALSRARELGWRAPLKWQLPYYHGVSRYLEGDYAEAERSFLEVLQRDTGHCASLYWLAKLYGDREDGRSSQYHDLLQALQPEFPDLIQHFL